ncbi:Uma2 family endonuclease, partial [Arthrospira sp. PCC 8006]|uniref:Uma2 family endonuclease n=1 Tax=Arthrospira sp. PCC 8006 TaxID=1982224 RepID=UPI00396F4329
MIAAKEKGPYFTPEEYFAWEEQQLEKHELIDGRVYAMTGGTRNHSDVTVNESRYKKRRHLATEIGILTRHQRQPLPLDLGKQALINIG